MKNKLVETTKLKDITLEKGTVFITIFKNCTLKSIQLLDGTVIEVPRAKVDLILNSPWA